MSALPKPFHQYQGTGYGPSELGHHLASDFFTGCYLLPAFIAGGEAGFNWPLSEQSDVPLVLRITGSLTDSNKHIASLGVHFSANLFPLFSESGAISVALGSGLVAEDNIDRPFFSIGIGSGRVSGSDIDRPFLTAAIGRGNVTGPSVPISYNSVQFTGDCTSGNMDISSMGTSFWATFKPLIYDRVMDISFLFKNILYEDSPICHLYSQATGVEVTFKLTAIRYDNSS